MRVVLRIAVVAAQAAVLLLLLSVRAASAGSYVEDFTTTGYCDVLRTTADWNTTDRELKLRGFHPAIVGHLASGSGGETDEVTIDGDYAYVADGAAVPNVLVVDISDPVAPIVIGSCSVPGGEVGRIAVAGDVGYLAAWQAGLRVLDISDPTQPSVIGALAMEYDVECVAVAGEYAYVANNLSGLRVVDVSDPTDPSIVRTVPMAGGTAKARYVVVSGNYAYVAASGAGLVVVDITDPAAASIVATAGLASYPYAVCVDGDYALLAAGPGGLQIIDISVPTNPVVVGHLPTTGASAHHVSVTGDFAYVADGQDGIHVVDITDPTSPAILASLDTDGRADGVTMAGEHGYVADDAQGVQVVRIAEPLVPFRVSSVNTPGLARGVAVAGDCAFVADHTSGLQVVDISVPTSPSLLGGCDTPGSAHAVALDGDRAYLADGFYGLAVVDVTNPGSPVLRASLGMQGEARDVAVDGDRAYVAALTSGLQVVNTTDPDNPVWVAGVITPGLARGVALAGDRAYVADWNAGLTVVNISDPVHPSVLTTLDTPGGAVDLALAGDYAFVADYSGGLQVIDISNPASPQPVASVATGSYTYGVFLAGDCAFVADYGGGLAEVDISDPEHPVLVGRTDTPGFALGVCVAGDYAFVADDDAGLQVMEVFQRRFDVGGNTGQSLAVDNSDQTVSRARLETTQTDSVSWELSANGGTNWEAVAPGAEWHGFAFPGSDLLWRSKHLYVGGGVNPACSHLQIEWEAVTITLEPSRIATYYPCGGTYPLDLWVHGVSDLGAFEICTGYDDDLASLEGAVTDTFLGSTGRVVYPLAAVPCDPDCNVAGIRYGAWSTGEETGPSGSGVLARLLFAGVGDAASIDSLCLEDWELVDTQVPPNVIDVAEATGAVVVHRSFCYGDFNDDGDVTVMDIMQVASRWGCCLGDGCYGAMYDVNLMEQGNYCASHEDGCIDVVDVQLVAGRWGQGCPDGGGLQMLAAGPESAPLVRVAPSALLLGDAPGDTSSFAVVIDGASDLGAFEVHLSFDPSVVHVENVVVGSFLGGGGRSVYPLGPEIDNEEGTATFGAWTLGEAPGASGDGTLARVVVSIQTCEETASLDLTTVTITDSQGWPQALGGMTGGSAQTICGTGVPDGSEAIPTEFALYTGRPNPVNASTTMSFGIPGNAGERVPVELVIYSVSGQVVRELVRSEYGPGYHEVVWDGRDGQGRDVASGVYFCRFLAGDYSETKRVTVLR